MAYQGFSQKMELAKAFAKAKSSGAAALSPEQKDQQKRNRRAHLDKLLAENLQQRALIESKRA